ncbi:WD40-repeat-containing domain protein [Peziza echinospora]|nr:WD40-repeat-containing domain protein [Peziza echinospora]
MKVTSQNGISVYTVSGASTSRSLPDWLVRKRKKSLRDDAEFQNRIELIQDFGFEEASQCIRVSEDGEYAMATGTYKPQHHTYHLPSLGMKYARHHVSLNLTFLLLSTDYTKSLHLQTDRLLEFHTPMGCHHSVRIPRYGRALAYQRQRAEALVPADGNEVYRLDLESGRFLKPFELDESVKSGESVAVEQNCHGLLAFGTDKGTVEFWDHRSRNRIGILTPPKGDSSSIFASEDPSDTNPAITALEFHPGGLILATGSSVGITSLYDIRSSNPLIVKDQQYGFPIQSLKFLHTPHDASASHNSTSTPKVLSADKRIIKIWDQETGAPWTSIEPSVDMNHLELVPNSGMIFTANEGQEMHSFFIPQLGPAPRWCSFLDNLTEEMAEAHLNDPDAYKKGDSTDQGISTYDNYKFVTSADLGKLGLDQLVGTPQGNAVLRPYMHGYFIDQRLYEELKLVTDPFEWDRERRKMIRDKIEKERESRIRTSKKDAANGLESKVKVNKKLAERLLKQEEKLARWSRKENALVGEVVPEDDEAVMGKVSSVLKDNRFGGLFDDPEFAVDENTIEFQQLHPTRSGQEAGGSATTATKQKRTRTAVESEEDDSDAAASSSDVDSDSEDSDAGKKTSSKPPPKKAEPEMRVSSSNYRKSGHDTRGFDPVSKNQIRRNKQQAREKTFAARAVGSTNTRRPVSKKGGEVLGEKEITWMPASTRKPKPAGPQVDSSNKKDLSGGGNRAGRRSASGNVFRGM